jgi:hypothetical protein
MSPVEEYIRNHRGPDFDGNYSDDVASQSLLYRFPSHNHQVELKLIRDDNDPAGILRVIHRNQDNFKYRESLQIDLNALIDVLDRQKSRSIDGSAFYILRSELHTEFGKKLVLCSKDEQGRLVSESGEVLYVDKDSSDYRNHDYMLFVAMAAFRLGNLPVYALVLNNQFIENKVLFVNKFDGLTVFAENEGVGRLRDTIFNPIFLPKYAFYPNHGVENSDVIQLRDTIITKGALGLNMFGANRFTAANGPSSSGSQIILNGGEPFSLQDLMTIETDFRHKVFDDHIEFYTDENSIGYIRISIDAGAFFEDCVEPHDQFKYEWVVHVK